MYVCMCVYTCLCVTYTKQVCIHVAITIEEVGNLRVDGRGWGVAKERWKVSNNLNIEFLYMKFQKQF